MRSRHNSRLNENASILILFIFVFLPRPLKVYADARY